MSFKGETILPKQNKTNSTQHLAGSLYTLFMNRWSFNDNLLSIKSVQQTISVLEQHFLPNLYQAVCNNPLQYCTYECNVSGLQVKWSTALAALSTTHT
jgi:hypothetical protein